MAKPKRYRPWSCCSGDTRPPAPEGGAREADPLVSLQRYRRIRRLRVRSCGARRRKSWAWSSPSPTGYAVTVNRPPSDAFRNLRRTAVRAAEWVVRPDHRDKEAGGQRITSRTVLLHRYLPARRKGTQNDRQSPRLTRETYLTALPPEQHLDLLSPPPCIVNHIGLLIVGLGGKLSVSMVAFRFSHLFPCTSAFYFYTSSSTVKELEQLQTRQHQT